MPQHVRIAGPVFVRPIEFLPITELVTHWALMEPGLGKRRLREILTVDLGEQHIGAMQTYTVIRLEGFGTELLDPTKAAKFALGPIPVAVMITVLGGELAFGELVNYFDSGDNVHRER